MRTTIIFGFIINFLVIGLAHGDSLLPPPAWPVPNIKQSPNVVQPVTGIALGSFQIVFEKTTFKDIASNVGAAPIRHQGDAGEFQMWVCYTLTAMHARLWLTSGELGGEEYIDGLVAEQIPTATGATSECPEPARSYSTVTIDNGIWLGKRVEAVKARLGEPNRGPKSVIYYSYEGKDGDFDITSVLALTIRKNRITALHATHSATN